MLLQVAVQDIGQLPYFEQNRRSFFLRYAAICAAGVTPSYCDHDCGRQLPAVKAS
jgi:hypothetical protein